MFGIDLVKARTEFHGTRKVTWFAGNQGDPVFMKKIVAEAGPFDVVIDDGGHHVKDQLASFSVLFGDGLAPGGMFFMEDIETSYWALSGETAAVQ